MRCPDDAEIVAFAEGLLDRERRKAIRDHADGCAECAGLIAEAVRVDPPTRSLGGEGEDGAEPEPSPDPGPDRGASMGRYLLLDLLGEGGLGRVYTAYDPELDRKIAIKLIRPEVTHHLRGDELSTRLVREAQALAKVRHPNVVAVHDVGTAHDRVFIAMELVEGATLRQWLAEQPREWPEIRDVFVAAAAGLDAAHRAGLVHRDFKPGNVLIGRDGRVQVADFGLARAVTGAVPPRPVDGSTPTTLSATITESGVVLGTPAYMAPEQHLGLDVDAKADLFAFCVALYEALYGTRPFAGDTVDALVEAIEAGRLRPPERALRVPRWLQRAVERGLRADPAARFESMAELSAELQRDRRQRRRWGAGLVVGALAIVAGAGWVRALSSDEEPVTMERVEELVSRTRAAAARAYFVYPPHDDPEAPTAYRHVLELEAIEGDAEAVADHRAAELRTELAATLVRLGDQYWERPGGDVFAVDYYANALVFDPSHPRASERVRLTPGQLAGLQDKAARLAFSEAELVGAEPLIALAQPDDAARIEALAELYAGSPRPGLGATVALESLLGDDAARVLGIDPRDDPASSPAAAPDLLAARDQPEPTGDSAGGRASEPSSASPEPRRAAGSSPPSEPEPRSVSETTDPRSAAALAAEGHAALREGRLDAAAQAFHGALRHDRRHASALGGLGEVNFQRQALDKAIDFFERATRAAPKNASYRIALGDAYFKVLRYDDALAQYDRARKLGSPRAHKRIDKLRAKLGAEADR